MIPWSARFVALLLSRDGVECRDIPHVGRSEVVTVAGKTYDDCGSTDLCGFYSSLAAGERIVGCEIALFPGFSPRWRDVPNVVFTAPNQVRIVWEPRYDRELLSGAEEWFLYCALFKAEGDNYCVVLDLPPAQHRRVVRTAAV